MVRLAYLDLPEKHKDRIACLAFISGIDNPRIEFTLRSERLESLQKAIERAIELKSILSLLNSKKQISQPFNHRFHNHGRHNFDSPSHNSTKLFTLIPIQTILTTNKFDLLEPKFFILNVILLVIIQTNVMNTITINSQTLILHEKLLLILIAILMQTFILTVCNELRNSMYLSKTIIKINNRIDRNRCVLAQNWREPRNAGIY